MDNYKNHKFVNVESDYEEVTRDLKELNPEVEKT